MITDRDKEIIYHVQQFGFITIGQCYSIWLSDRKYGYDIARKHLNKIVKEGYLKSYKPISNIYAEKVFYMEDKYATPTRSMVITMDVYAELKRLGADIIHFKREEKWLDGKYKSDGFAVFKLNKFIFSTCIEVIDSTKLTYINHRNDFTKKYSSLYGCDVLNSKIVEVTNIDRQFESPTLLVISELTTSNLELEGVNVIYLDYSLQKLSQIFI